MTAKHLAVADTRAAKGTRQFVMVRTATWDEPDAVQRAGVAMVSVPPEMMVDPCFREVAPTLFAVPGPNWFGLAEGDDFLRRALRMVKATADAVCCSAGLPTIRRLAEDNIPVINHIGLIPSRATWTGGFKAVGKTAESAMAVYRAAKALEAPGAFGAEIEVVPADMADEIAGRTSLFLVSMGAGTGSDCQYLFAEDLLGENRGHMPRHAKVHRNLAAECDRLQAERVAGFGELVADVASGACPEPRHLVATDPEELRRFSEQLDADGNIPVMDPPEHTELRRPVQGTNAFPAASIAAKEPQIAALEDGLIDRFVETGSADLVEAFTCPLPLAVGPVLVGFPPEDLPMLDARQRPTQVRTLGVRGIPPEAFEAAGRRCSATTCPSGSTPAP